LNSPCCCRFEPVAVSSDEVLNGNIETGGKVGNEGRGDNPGGVGGDETEANPFNPLLDNPSVLRQEVVCNGSEDLRDREKRGIFLYLLVVVDEVELLHQLPGTVGQIHLHMR